ncbi:ABC transporter substrate-binding protein [Streptomonospora salina]|uniref:Iron complex transport system substrate-binding protein n=1 Tax=Streptomonospora salina TaxID=104205 RepID=A0A841EFF9_9ACTN|nr:ABC transporter substrate-binding protein [Streptomonospora salina]MBB5999628.1 iron complex transport system substrate-binding protein [Streptomonospora salina]
MPSARRLSAALLLAALTLSACGGPQNSGQDQDPSESQDAGFPVTVEDASGEVTLESAPERIVSLTPSVTEMLFAIDAGDQVTAVDEHSDHPEEAPTTDLSGFEPSVEAIVEYEPDLVVLARNAAETADQLKEVDVPVLILPSAADLDQAYDQMRTLGEATGNADRAGEVADRVESDVDAIVEETTAEIGESDLTYYHELDSGMYSVTSETFIGQVYDRFGLQNIADSTEDTAGGYPQLSAEYVVDQNPDLVFLAYPGEGAVEDLGERPAFDSIDAVSDGDVVHLDPDIASRWGPRVVDLAESVSAAVTDAAQEG